MIAHSTSYGSQRVYRVGIEEVVRVVNLPGFPRTYS